MCRKDTSRGCNVLLDGMQACWDCGVLGLFVVVGKKTCATSLGVGVSRAVLFQTG